MKLTGTLIRLGSLVCGPIATIVMFATGTVKCGGGEPIDFTSSTTGDEGGSGGTGGVGGSGGEETSGTGATGGGGDATGGSGTGGTGGAGGSTVSSGGVGGTTTSTGGGLPVGCEPLSATGTNCASNVCGAIDGYDPSDPVCAAACAEEAFAVGVMVDDVDFSIVFDDFSQKPGCADCQWSYVIRVVGSSGCARATVSEGLHVAKVFEPTVCGPASSDSCVVAQPKSAPIAGQLRFVVTANAGGAPDVGWLRIETTNNDCQSSGYVCN